MEMVISNKAKYEWISKAGAKKYSRSNPKAKNKEAISIDTGDYSYMASSSSVMSLEDSGSNNVSNAASSTSVAYAYMDNNDISINPYTSMSMVAMIVAEPMVSKYSFPLVYPISYTDYGTAVGCCIQM